MPRVTIGTNVDLAVLLAAIREVESSNGRDPWPRVEAAFLPYGYRTEIQGRLIVGTGRLFSPVAAERWAEWGALSAASWGEWQVHFQTAADLGFTGAPGDLLDPATCRKWATRFLRRAEERGARLVEEFADAYNSGDHRDGFRPERYIDDVVSGYLRRWRPEREAR